MFCVEMDITYLLVLIAFPGQCLLPGTQSLSSAVHYENQIDRTRTGQKAFLVTDSYRHEQCAAGDKLAHKLIVCPETRLSIGSVFY